MAVNFAYIDSQRKRMNAEQKARKYVPLEENCKHCGSSTELIRHHPDYDKPLEIITLCKSCHINLHLKLKPFKKTKINFQITCPFCHTKNEENFFKNGFKKFQHYKVQRYQCKQCGRVFHE